MLPPPRIGFRRALRSRPITVVATALLTLSVILTLALESVTAAPPGSKPGGKDAYPHRTVRKKELGWGATSYWLFEPADPQPEMAPVVVLNHGWLGVNPGAYGAWIEHLVRSGKIVIFPRYQADAFTRPSDFLPNVLAAVTDALDVLDTAPGHVRPDRSRFALIGHSAGGNLAAQMAAVAADSRLPKPRALITLMPGEVQPLKEPDLSRIPADTLLVVTVAEDDRVVGDARGREIFTQASAIPLNRKKFVFYRTDLHGTPRLLAHHLSPTAAHADHDTGDGLMRGFQMTKAEVNAFDIAGFWRLADITMDAAFAGKTLDEATEKGAAFRHLGYWSDGRPVERPVVGDDLSLMPRVIPSNGVRLIKLSPDFGFPDLFPKADPGPIADKPGTTTRR